MSDAPTVSIKYSEYERLRTGLDNASSKIAELTKQLEDARLIDPAGTIKQYNIALCAALKIVQFAVANNDPATVRGWPFEALRDIARMIKELPGIPRNFDELPLVFEEVAERAASYEATRQQNRRAAVFATAADFGPQTPEAALVHGIRVRADGSDAQATPPSGSATVTVTGNDSKTSE